MIHVLAAVPWTGAGQLIATLFMLNIAKQVENLHDDEQTPCGDAYNK